MRIAIDHVLFAGEDLEVLVNDVFMEAGVRATAGGKHAGQGTHNALIGLGPGRYLELMAQDPEGDDDRAGAYRRSIAYLREPALHTWCARTDDVEVLVRRASEAGLSVVRSEGGRVRPDGTPLRWTLVALGDHPFGGLVPFFIDWRDSPHPSRTLLADLRLTRLTLAHPQADDLARLLRDLGGPVPDVETTAAARPRIRARLVGRHGPFELTGEGRAMQFA
ncbi:MAG: VOC family protein [Trueperaceae bacterium]